MSISLSMVLSSSPEGNWPRLFMKLPSSCVEMDPSPCLSNRRNARRSSVPKTNTEL